MKLFIKIFLLMAVVSGCVPAMPANLLPSPDRQEHQDFSYRITWSPDDSLIALTTNTGLYVYDTKSYKQLAAFAELGGAVAVFSEKYLAAVTDKKLFVWDLKEFRLLFTRDAGNESRFQSVVMSPDADTLVTAEQEQIRYWSLPAGELIAGIPSANFVSDMAFSGNDRLIVADSYLGTIQEWDVKTRKQVRAFGVSKPVVYFNLSQDGKLVVVDYGDYGFEIWDVETGRLQHEYADIIGAPGWNNLSGDTRTVTVWGYGIGEESGLSVWDLTHHDKISEFLTPIVNGDGWRFGALNSDSTVLAASTNEGFIYFYDVTSSAKIGEIFLPYKFSA